MATQEQQQSSDEVRKRGNDLYMEGKLSEAVKCYKHAAELAPSEAAPLSNLSAAYFELGQYTQCYAACAQALSLLQGGDDGPKQKLFIRQAKSSIHALDLPKARTAIELLTTGKDKTSLSACLQALEKSGNGQADARRLHEKIMLQLPRYKPQIQDAAEYFVVGHDNAESIYDTELLDTDRKTISLMFGGIGDARHLHLSLVLLGADVLQGRIRDKRVHFTIVDHKLAVIARDFVVLLMLDRLSAVMRTNKEQSNSILTCLYYTYLSVIMPRRASEVLQVYIQRAIDMLEQRESLPRYLDIPGLYRPEVIRILREWQYEAAAAWPASRLRKEIVYQRSLEKIRWDLHYKSMMGAKPEVPAHWTKEQSFYEKTGVLTMPGANKDDQIIRTAYERTSDGRIVDAEAVNAHVDAEWATNVTFIDLEWLHKRPFDGKDIDVADDPWSFGTSILGLGIPFPAKARLGKICTEWFAMIASTIQALKDRVIIEACLGDITAVLEQVGYGLVGRRERSTPAAGSVSAETLKEISMEDAPDPDISVPDEANAVDSYPVMYDRIHLSNIPDYIGGTLSSFLYALPVTNTGKGRYITSTCLRNPPMWPSEAHFHNEYIGLSDPKELARVFHVFSSGMKDDEYQKHLMSLPKPQPMNDYHF